MTRKSDFVRSRTTLPFASRTAAVTVTTSTPDLNVATGACESAAAGEPWDDLVRDSVERGWAGLECLSGIPGLVGATPMQNVGAYGQEVGECVSNVRALDTATGRSVAFANRECRFDYRDSVFRSGEPGRYVVLSVSYRLRPGGAATVRYVDVEKALASQLYLQNEFYVDNQTR